MTEAVPAAPVDPAPSGGGDRDRPLALTMGDPAGVGPELALAAWHAARAAGDAPFLVVGAAQAFDAVPGRAVPIVAIDDPAKAAQAFATGLPVLKAADLAAQPVPGRPDVANAPATIAAIDRAVTLARAGAVAGLVTNPIAKHVLRASGFAHAGHTDYLAHLCGRPADAAVMMLAGRHLRTVPVTVHLPLAHVPAALTPERLTHVLRTTHRELQTRFGIAAPRLAVTGLNPHAGEDGMLGYEEQRVIAPVLDRLRGEGLDLAGPLPADTLFHAEARAGYDAAVAMYHDQALIPVKALDFFGTVNVTLGLEIVRTSPDHGTAFDRAGTNSARPDSLIAALRLARAMAARADATPVAS
ncbi:4-hydroxythreonine-4-phosphate dehydrogenase [Rhodothalassium salexigens DSM 2132]|uniref:4-hydroxythreonine-4-phosphate dehydrogenase n=1 Tax=Rhodothalassium salexigens DSM 2132 TaxID=1188247 RepID=A0A4R2PWA5_RHOSA|nr:4-hydroxythreonine-4-phosphate dehydrogenase PdxA [Rhodothalassium salexigens]MBB4210267.1 4-hydroxythreonine-4-phosphate dehydrogenase [Rhodothalassium salexigens DSM 2132]MBK1638787.1 4-hydroxythreonine-4-phosphate dehydrogenase PdxA [Rhodothalassium salexigens DSM 2132]TCP38431.1 4-hydroxythreonine-4-phosphate dehydrogenase [Rhodothalassium salexigens DSM 2132]